MDKDRNRFSVFSGGLSDPRKRENRDARDVTPFEDEAIDFTLEEEEPPQLVSREGSVPFEFNAFGADLTFKEGSQEPLEEEDEGPMEYDRSAIASQDYRWAWAEIDLGNIVHNMQTFRKRISPRVKLMAVVKADGYGHGAVQVARAAAQGGATWFGVATVDEALELRDAGFKQQILILSQPPVQTVPLLIDNDIIPAVYETEFAIALGEYAASKGKVAKYHLAVNTGMNRIGVWFENVVEFIEALSFHSALQLDGIFTHFATADVLDEYYFRLQLRRFREVLAALESARINPGIVHAAATAAAIRYKESHFDMVRIGIGLYGLHPSPATRTAIELWPAMSVKTRITCVNDVPVGDGVSYGGTFQSMGNTLVATVPLGYADGLSRQLSNGMNIIHKGRFCKQVGNICMDQFMFAVDKSEIIRKPYLRPEVGDEVIIIGRSGDYVLHLDDMADALMTINYELACRFGMRLRKIYIDY